MRSENRSELVSGQRRGDLGVLQLCYCFAQRVRPIGSNW